jgi:hypothetical protein
VVEKGPELAGFLYDRLVSETSDPWFGRHIGAFFSGQEIPFPGNGDGYWGRIDAFSLEIPFPGNGDRSRQRLGSNGELLRRKPRPRSSVL